MYVGEAHENHLIVGRQIDIVFHISPQNYMFWILIRIEYGKCPKNSNTKASDKMTYTNSVDPDQTAPSGAV